MTSRTAIAAASFGLDHLVVLVEDLEEAGARYARFGFTVAPQMHHPFGTANRLITFQQTFLELVGVVRPEALSGPGLLVAERLAQSGQGAFGIALLAADIERDRGLLVARGLGCGDIGGGSRVVPLPSGTERLARFSTALIPGPAGLESIFFFLAQQHVPEAVWVPAWQRHPNGARAWRSVTLAVPDMASFVSYLQTLFGPSQVAVQRESVLARTPLGTIAGVSTAEAARRYGPAPADALPGRVCAATIGVDDIDLARNLVETGGTPTSPASGGGFRIGPAETCGVILEFQGPS